MCGLLAYFSTDADRVDDATVEAVREAQHCMRHRGPDENEAWWDSRAVFGFNRLSFIDIEHSHQPMPYADGRYRIVFNGEIYNYLELRAELAAAGATFATEGDTEAIVAGYHLWGEDVVHRLRGMFAFVIWDSRDADGVRRPRPLRHQAAVHHPPRRRRDRLLLREEGAAGAARRQRGRRRRGLRLAAALPDAAVRPGAGDPAPRHPPHRERHELHGRGRRAAHERATSTRRFPIRPVAKNEEQALYDRIADVLDDSVRMHMRADVTVGSFLSGGIDSTAIAALAKRYNPNLLTFTTGFERAGFSEIDVAAESAAAIGVEHITKVVTPEEFADAIPLVVWYLDDPVADPALVPLYFIAREARKHVKVVLSGEGADELFGGYNIYREPLSLAAFEKLPSGVLRALGRLSTKLPDGMRGKDLLRRGSIPLEQRYYGNARIFRDDELGFLERRDPDLSHVAVTAELYERTRAAGYDDVTAMQYVDLFTWLRGDILVKADKMTMANSLELRVPFLDPEVFKVAGTLPVDQRVTKETTKYALRRALEQIVPPHVLNRRKLGFPVPTRHWLAEQLHDWARLVIEESQTDEWLDKQQVLAMLAAHRENQRNGSAVDYSRKLWTLLVFMIWHGIFVEGRIKPEIPETVYPVRL